MEGGARVKEGKVEEKETRQKSKKQTAERTRLDQDRIEAVGTVSEPIGQPGPQHLSRSRCKLMPVALPFNTPVNSYLCLLLPALPLLSSLSWGRAGFSQPYGSFTRVCYPDGIMGILIQAHVLWGFKIKHTNFSSTFSCLPYQSHAQRINGLN